ncbi:hypothetical protein TZ03_27280 [Pseudomonas sp. 10-1B]|uniref:hypothetical protein n=1 Tax=Pseudomonas sp. 10-1B TaxID=1546029 RepID=UPI00061E9643|nr:hypothetical protein [Pseudomonas sp. 10-1B]KIY37541.1 hypothetical protein TZ03_27280 [Pseudomonas sp. 10-1B]
MSFENRLHFEAELLKELKFVASHFEGVVASKNKLKFKHGKKFVAELFFDHLSRIDSYVLGGMVYGGKIHEYVSSYTPPYKNNLFNEASFSFMSSGEQNKRFSGDLGGAIKTPSSNSVVEVCLHIRSVLEEFYVSKILACIIPAKRTISDVVSSPNEYAYPAVFIHCAVKLSEVPQDKEQIEAAMKSKKIVKDRSYDVPLLEELL